MGWKTEKPWFDFQQGHNFVTFVNHSDRRCGQSSLHLNGTGGIVFPGENRLRHEADHSSASGVEFKNVTCPVLQMPL
jgi:hypothetical protein